jgi:hypothetical protein
LRNKQTFKKIEVEISHFSNGSIFWFANLAIWRKDRPCKKSYFFRAYFPVNGMDDPTSNLT